MQNSEKITKNYIFNLLYQLLLIISPIVTTPYLARTIFNDGIGLYSYAYSIATYFILFGALGFTYYSQREMAKHKDNMYDSSKLFWEIFILRIIFVFASLAIYLPLSVNNIFDNKTIMLILSIDVISVAFDITFYFQAKEKFGLIMIISSLSKITNIVLIFMIVKSSSDVDKYALCQSVFVLLNAIMLWPFLIKKLKFVNVKELNLLRHLKPVLILFIPTIAISIYRTLDKTLIGIICEGNEENGFYENSEKIIRVALTIITSLGSVMISRNSNLLKEGQIEKFNNNIFYALRFVLFLSIPMIIGVFIVSNDFVPLFFGDGFEPVSNLMKVYSFVFIFVGISNVIGLQFLVVCAKDKQYIISIVIGALTNLLLNLWLIRYYGAMGATIATIIAEFIIMALMLIFTRKEINYLNVVTKSFKYFISGGVLIVIGIIMHYFMPHTTILLFVRVIISIISYFGVLLLLKDEFVLMMIRFIKSKVLKDRGKKYDN